MSQPPPLPGRDAIERALERALAPTLEDQFLRYLDLVVEANERAGLTSLEDPTSIVERHFAESVALLSLMRAHPWTASHLSDDDDASPRLADIGPGGGFPGVPLRLVEPSIQLTLLESHGRRAAFLEDVVTALSLTGVEVVRARAEEAGRNPVYREQFHLVTARAVARLPVLVEYAVPLLRPGGVLVTPKGSSAREEVEAAAGALDALGAEAAEPLPLANVRADAAPTVILVRRVGDLDDRYPRRPGIPSKRPIGV